MKNLREAVETLIDHLTEAHREEIDNKHYGDDSCSYCRDIEAARKLLEQPEVGEIGLPISEYGSIIQACCAQLVDRGHDKDTVISALRGCDEQNWWDVHGGPLLDELETYLELDVCPECGDTIDDGEGYDGLCGSCADKKEAKP